MYDPILQEKLHKYAQEVNSSATCNYKHACDHSVTELLKSLDTKIVQYSDVKISEAP